MVKLAFDFGDSVIKAVGLKDSVFINECFPFDCVDVVDSSEAPVNIFKESIKVHKKDSNNLPKIIVLNQNASKNEDKMVSEKILAYLAKIAKGSVRNHITVGVSIGASSMSVEEHAKIEQELLGSHIIEFSRTEMSVTIDIEYVNYHMVSGDGMAYSMDMGISF